MKKCFLALLLPLLAIVAQAQIQEPVKVKTELRQTSPEEIEIIFHATIDPGWHVYSTDLGDVGPIPASFNIDNISGAELVGKLKPSGKEISAYDKMFGMELRYFEHEATFIQKLKLTQETYHIEGFLEYGACNDESCLPPTPVPFSYSGP